MESVEKILTLLWKTILFFIMSILFLPSFIIVTYIQKPWSDLFNELF